MSIEFWEIVISVINFLIFFFLLKKFFFKKVEAAMADRRRIIESDLAQAEADKAEAEQLLARAKAEQIKIQGQGRTMLTDYKRKADVLTDEMLTEARAEAKRIIARGNQEAAQEREQAQKDIKRQVVELATVLSQKAIGEDAKESTHDRLVDEVLNQLGGK